MQNGIDHQAAGDENPADASTEAESASGQAEADATPPVDPLARLRSPANWVLFAIAVGGLYAMRKLRWLKLADHPNRPQFFEPALGVVAFFGAMLAAMIAVRVGWYALAPDAKTMADWTARQSSLIHLCAYGAQLAALVPILILLNRVESRRGRTFRRPTRSMAIIAGAAAMLIAWPCAHIAGQVTAIIIETTSRAATPTIVHDTLQELAAAEQDIWLWVRRLTVVLLVPFIEEVMYRGIAQESLRRLGFGPWLAIISTSALFALMHASAVPANGQHALVALFVLSIFFGWLYERTGRLSASVTLHAVFNAANLLLASLYMTSG